MSPPDALVVGSGPNGLSGAIVLARAGLDVEVREARETPGGGARSGELTRPGFVHDLCSAVHPMAAASPFFATLPPGAHGLEWVHPDAPLAHPLGASDAVVLERELDGTLRHLDPADRDPYRALFEPLVSSWEGLLDEILSPLHLPRHPLLLARFGLRALRSASGLAGSRFSGPRARALFAGIAAHSTVPLERPGTAAFGLVLGAAGHAVGWPVARGGSGAITRALVGHLRSLGGTVRVDAPVTRIDDVDDAAIVLADVTPRQLLDLAGHRLPGRYRDRLARFRYGPGVFKLDWALSEPIPWQAEGCRRAGTVHLGGLLEDVARAERAPWEGRIAPRPFVLLAQPSLFDPTRAPEGRHTAWAYCHVPHGSTEDATRRVEDRIERFAPGFRETILGRSALGPEALEARNPNLVGGDIGGGAQTLAQLLRRPVVSPDPYSTPLEGIYLCSASTPPGAGVHGMCGYHAARSALRDRGIRVPEP